MFRRTVSGATYVGTAAAGALLLYVVGMPSARPWTAQLLTLTILVVPLLASGIGPVRMDGGAEDAE